MSGTARAITRIRAITATNTTPGRSDTGAVARDRRRAGVVSTAQRRPRPAQAVTNIVPT